ncbi:MAG: L,D-transpeptidase family protein [Rhodospirillaceae bacterium]|nr:L,D-transpeptidase family protein [Rhodospirillaceae bacterium]
MTDRFRRPIPVATLALLLLALVAPPAAAGRLPLADKVVVLKSQRKLLLLKDGAVIKSYPIALGPNPVGQKRRRGDGRTPEGLYVIDGRDPDSYFHRALHISYPNLLDLRQAQESGELAGGGILIHGLPPGFGPYGEDEPMIDWTDGCIAVTNKAMDEIWDSVRDGTIIDIRP